MINLQIIIGTGKQIMYHLMIKYILISVEN